MAPVKVPCFLFSGDGKLRSRAMQLNGTALVLGENDTLPALTPVEQPAGTLELAPGTCTFLVL